MRFPYTKGFYSLLAFTVQSQGWGWGGWKIKTNPPKDFTHTRTQSFRGEITTWTWKAGLETKGSPRGGGEMLPAHRYGPSAGSEGRGTWSSGNCPLLWISATGKRNKTALKGHQAWGDAGSSPDGQFHRELLGNKAPPGCDFW